MYGLSENEEEAENEEMTDRRTAETASLWRIRLLGELRAVWRGAGEVREVSRFRTQSAAGLLAYLAYHKGHSHSREILIELLWPDTPPQRGRHNLSNALSSLRSQFEPPGIPAGAILIADRLTVELNPTAVTTDVEAFEEALRRAAQTAALESQKIEELTKAIQAYALPAMGASGGGVLLPGYYDPWIALERERLAQRFRDAALQLSRMRERRGEWDEALWAARLAVAAASIDPDEGAGASVIRTLIVRGETAAVLHAYRELEQALPEIPGAHAAAISAVVPTTFSETDRRTYDENEIDKESAGNGKALPLAFTRFFGREAEIAELSEMLLDPAIRLITLIGPGGSGKTRLALEAAGRLLDEAVELGNGIRRSIAAWFVPLADVADPAQVPTALVAALGARLPPSAPDAGEGDDSLAQGLKQAAAILASSKAGSTLLVLDNIEHLLPGDGSSKDTDPVKFIRYLLQEVSSLTILVTSRQLLGLAGERAFLVSPLPTPNSGEVATSPEQLLSLYDSVRLFLDRAQAVKPDFQVTNRNAPAVAELCDRLEGIPLAIELAAARAAVLTPNQMLAQVSDRFALLVSRQRGVAERQRTLRATLDWSYRLLSPELQRFFARLSVFRGGWTAEAAAEILDEPVALDQLAQLRDASLILAAETRNGMRFSLLETLREYAGDVLEPEEKSHDQHRHRDYFLTFAEEADAGLDTPEQLEWLDRMEIEQANFAVALEFCFEMAESDAEPALRLVGALGRFWEMRGHIAEGHAYLQRALEKKERVPAPVLARALYWAGIIAGCLIQREVMRALITESLSLYRAIGDAKGIAAALRSLSLYMTDLTENERMLQESLDLARSEDDTGGVAWALNSLGRLAVTRGDYKAAHSYIDESLSRFRGMGNWTALSHVFHNLGYLAIHQNDLPRARSAYEQASRAARHAGDVASVADADREVAAIAFQQGDLAEARRRLNACLSAVRDTGYLTAALQAIGRVAVELALADSRYVHAATLFGALVSWYDSVGYSLPPHPKGKQVRDALGDTQYRAAVAEGSAMTLSHMVSYVLSWEKK